MGNVLRRVVTFSWRDCTEAADDANEESLRKPLPGSVGPIIKTLTGKTISLQGQCLPDTTFAEMKQMIQDKEGIPPEDQRIIFAGRQCEDWQTIGGDGINAETNSTFHLVLRLPGFSGED